MRCTYDLEITKIVAFLDVPKEVDHCENPPWISAQRFIWSGPWEQPLIYSIEECEIGIDLHDPVSLRENDGSDIKKAKIPAQERLVLNPCHDIVDLPRRYDQGRR